MKKYEYKYIIQGNAGDSEGWFRIMSFCPSYPIQHYIDEQKEMHPNWDIRVIDNPKWKKFKTDTNGKNRKL